MAKQQRMYQVQGKERTQTPSWDFTKAAVCEGVIAEHKTVELDDRQCGLSTILVNKKPFAVWHSTDLKVLAKIPTGSTVRIKFEGVVSCGKGRTMKLFSISSSHHPEETVPF